MKPSNFKIQKQKPLLYFPNTEKVKNNTPDMTQAFFPAFAAAIFARFFCPLLIITMLRKVPTTALPTRRRITGIRIAQTRGGKRACRK